jgi:DNA-binding NarL/FixJ family response regulator
MLLRILLADCHGPIRGSLRQLLESEAGVEVVAECASASETLSVARDRKPDIAVIDWGIAGASGRQTIAQLINLSPQTAVIVLSLHSDRQTIVEAVSAGARGYVLKNCAGEDLIRAVREVYDGSMFFSVLAAAALGSP